MPTYEYECNSCSLRFERQQAIIETPLTECPKCHGKVRRLISGGLGFTFKNNNPRRTEQNRYACSVEQGGKTCCGRDERCEKPPCGN